MIKRNKIICKVIAASISLCVFTTYMADVPVLAAYKSTQNNVKSDDSKTSKVDGMIIKDGVLLSAEDAEGDVEIPSNVTKISKEAFEFNDKVTSVEIPDSVKEIGEDAFDQCENLTKVSIPGSVKVIPARAFTNCNLTEVIIDDGVETIEKEAFSFNKELKEINIPDSVKLIKSRAFYQCSSLKDINYSKDTELEISAFAFTEYHPGDDDFFVVDGVLKDLGVNTYGDVVIPDGVKEISPDAFKDSTIVTKVVIPEGVKSIDKETFSRCFNLKEVVLPESLETIDDSAFLLCDNLTQIKLPSKLKTIGACAFNGCSGLSEISIPDSVASIGYNAFTGCSNLVNVNINTNGKTIGNEAFPIGVKFNGNSITQDNNEIPSNSVTKLNPGWTYIEGYWYYADASGNMYRNQWYFNGYNWYYLSGDGKMYTGGPIDIGGVKYMFSYPNGEMMTGWQYDHLMRAWNYFNPVSDGTKGAMVKSKWVYTGGKWYYLKDNGNMARNTSIDGYYVDDSGAWVQ
ncbi:MAG: leucine-rich repeat protein [Clostridium sp.]|nr:leucine-rich repeat protein [Clostridium sp.]